MDATSDSRVDTTSERRFDPYFDIKFAATTLLAIAPERSLEILLEKFVRAAISFPATTREEVWLIEKGDICSHCPQRPQCPDQTRCLHLVAAANSPLESIGDDKTRLPNTDVRIPLGVGVIGKTAVTGQQTVLRDLYKEPGEFSRLDWLTREQVRGFEATAISFKGEILGVITNFARVNIPEAARTWSQIFADHIGGTIANARAFEKIERLNQNLRLELAERKQAEEKLRDSEQRYRRIVDTASEGIIVFDEHHVTTFVNRRMAEMLGYELEDMVGRKYSDYLFEEDLADIEQRTTARRHGIAERYVHRARRKDGRSIWVHVSATPILDAEQNFRGSFSMFTDITERKMAEDELRKHRDHLEELVKQRTEELALLNQLVYGSIASSDVGAWWIDFQEEDTYHALDNTVQMIGLAPDKTGEKSYKLSQWAKLLADAKAAFPEYADVIDQTLERFAGAISGKYENYRASYPAVLPDGSVKWFDIRADVPLRDERGQALLMTGTIIDITKLKGAEEALARGHLLLRALIDNLPDAIYTKDTAGRKTLANPADLKTLRCNTEAEAIGKSDFDLFPKDLAEKFWADDQKVIAGEPLTDREEYYFDEDGRKRWLLTSKLPLRDQDGKVVGLIGIGHDITQQRQVAEELVAAKERAEAANRAKSIFLASMSHELRTPLNVLLGFSRLMKNDQGVPANQKENLDIIVRSGEHLLNLINNVLDISKIESGRVVLEESDTDLHQLLHELHSLMGVGASEKGLSFTLDQSPTLPRHIAVDAGKLRQVLINLIGNATKYAESGGVELRADVVSCEAPPRALLRFEVRDSGRGISEEDRKRIFFPFVQLGNRAPTEAGSGLGLAISKQYVELMGGRIDVASEPGKGSVFSFEIPVVVLPTAETPAQLGRGRVIGLAEGQPRFRLLIVEDQRENRLLLKKLFEPLGFDLREAVNGQEAVALFEEWRPDLIWMDIRMPVMDGLEAARRIKATEAGGRTKIVALTAHALEEEREPILAAGCDDLVRKPYREQELFEVMARHLGLKYSYETEGERILPSGPKAAFPPEQWAALPAELLTQLHQAAVELNSIRTLALIERVKEHDASIGCFIHDLARKLDYRQLLKLLESHTTKGGQTS